MTGSWEDGESVVAIHHKGGFDVDTVGIVQGCEQPDEVVECFGPQGCDSSPGEDTYSCSCRTHFAIVVAAAVAVSMELDNGTQWSSHHLLELWDPQASLDCRGLHAFALELGWNDYSMNVVPNIDGVRGFVVPQRVVDVHYSELVSVLDSVLVQVLVLVLLAPDSEC
ncbi:uncharacterized protein EAE97_012080 [Botrytis byssoidea]|uniref:Uncharacterized protein n=1 Tax=Botrytis byssoidea TaxID=139641 RepID=A0A9P5HT80_9HELO|nr:uncharacterized protein EAE97_012080 [Botrytis byssoidea]KAF7916842.1 hypothetical protein EAE97_012080 [Botrytis byssoidea]